MSTSLEKLQSKNISHKDSTMDYRKSATLFLETLAETSAKYQKSKECSGNNALSTMIHDRKDNGIYYTDIYLAQKLASQTIQKYVELHGMEKLSRAKFFEPCNGIGIFTFAYLIESQKLFEKEYKANWKEKVVEQLSHVYVADFDQEALQTYADLLASFCSMFDLDIDIKKVERNIWSHGLIYRVNEADVEWIDFEEVKEYFKLKESFDIILTNPPYKKLKAEKQQFQHSSQFETAKQVFHQITTRLRTESQFTYSIEGTLNLYKLFTESILEEYTDQKAQAIVGVLIPYNILMDLQCQKLRNRILERHSLLEVITFQENNDFFQDSTQSLCYLLLEVVGQTVDVKFLHQVSNMDDFIDPEYITTPVDLITRLTTSNSIIPLLPIEKSILEKTLHHQHLEKYQEVQVLRGELDLTLGKPFIVDDQKKRENSLPLIRGNILGSDYTIKGDTQKEWVLVDEFVKKSPQKSKLFTRERIACQQIVNMKKRKRISFSKVKPNHILANSCNFMTVEKDTMALDALLGYMNSSFVDWRFKMTSSNNHVNNYELLEIPLPDPHTFRTSYLHIQEEVERYVSTFDAPHLAAIDAEVFRLFRCDVDEVLHILTELQKPISYISRVLFLAFHERTVQKLLAEYMEKLEKNPE